MTKNLCIPLTKKISLLFTVIIIVRGTAYASIQNCEVGDDSKGNWEYVYPDDISKAVCTFPAAITSSIINVGAGNFNIEGGRYRGNLMLALRQPGDPVFECSNNNFIYEPQGTACVDSSLERCCLEGAGLANYTKFESGYCYHLSPPYTIPDSYYRLFGGGQVVYNLQEWKCRPETPEPVEHDNNQGPPMCEP